MKNVTPLDLEKTFGSDEIIVSKTDLKGVITYGNELFIKMSGYKEQELLGAPHNIIRHPDMPRVVFRVLWETLHKKNEIFAYVKNLSKDGSYYWVLANVTCSMDLNSNVVGYHSVRRKPEKSAVALVSELYKEMLAAEKKGGMEESGKLLADVLRDKKKSYEEFVLSL